MATNRRRPSENRPNLMEDLMNIQRGLFLAGIEGAGALADATQEFASRAVQNQPFSRSRTLGDALRETPETLNAAMAPNNALIDLPRRMVDAFYREYPAASGQRTGSGSAYRSEPETPESIIVTTTQEYLDGIPQGGALVSSVVNHVALTTGYPLDIIRTVVLRNFVSNGVVMRNQPPEEAPAHTNPIVARMQQTLADLGYADLRTDCPLLALPDTEEKAALAAFESGAPLVLCYAAHSANSPREREAARFQAAALSPDKAARYVWVSDGARNYYLDTERDVAIAALPAHASSTGTP